MITLAADLIATGAELTALRPAWEALWRRVPGASPFQSPAWLLPWWGQFGTDRPRVAVLRAGARLLGVLPLYVLEEGAARKLLPIGIGLTDHLDALLAPDSPEDAVAVLLRTALRAAEAEEIGACNLTDLPPGSPLRTALPPPGWQATLADTDPCPVLRLPPTVARLPEAVPARTLRKLRMNRNRARRIGGWAVETATPETTPALLDALVRLHTARWTGCGEAGVFADPRVPAFHRAAVPELLAAGLLRLQVLRLRGRIAAACYALVAGEDRILFYLSGFDAEFAHESPGNLLLGDMLEEAIREGRQEADFLRGGESYKYAWGAVDRMNAGRRLVRV